MIGYQSHKERENRAAYYPHGYKGRSLLCTTAQVFDPQTENSRKHNAEKEVDHEQGYV